ncbi:unnamed protein product [Adineta ricciae]|uniref:Uncharacterized protein n=1 Tax=Adineta ricciae TaxID=249248 RepID=A0A814HGL5_ADIRI|nr:unnamed protein product [Adineta ricciae]
MAVSDVKKIYQDVIEDVCSAVREALTAEGCDDHTLQELRNLWLERLENSKAVEPPTTSTVDQVTNREYRHPTTGDTNHSSTMNNKHPAGIKSVHSRVQQATNSGVSNFNNYTTATNLNPSLLSSANSIGSQFVRATYSITPTNPSNIGNSTMQTANQLDGAHDEECTKKSKQHRKKKPPIIEISFQLDGTGPPVGDDEDDDEDSDLEGNDVAEDLEDDDDEDGAEEGKEDPNPLCSDDDVSDDEPAELFETENVVVCQYDKISRTKNKWRFILKSGIMNLEGRDYVFSKATGDADW